MSNVYRLGAQYHAPMDNPLGIALKNLANHKLASKHITVMGLGSSMCTHNSTTEDTLELGRVVRYNM